MIDKTEAIVLRVNPLRSSSQVTVWLTREGFRKAVLVKGALAPRSPYIGQYDLGYTCELLYYTRDRGGLHQIRECAPLATRLHLRTDWAAMAGASYACHLVNLTLPEGGCLPALYPLLNTFLDTLADDPGTTHLFRFELALLHLLGLAPRLHACTRCGARCGPAGPDAVFSAEAGGLVCNRCAPGGDGERQPVDAAVLDFLRDPAGAARRDLSLMAEFQTARILGHFLDWHLDLAPGCRTIALRLLRYRASRHVNAN